MASGQQSSNAVHLKQSGGKGGKEKVVNTGQRPPQKGRGKACTAAGGKKNSQVIAEATKGGRATAEIFAAEGGEALLTKQKRGEPVGSGTPALSTFADAPARRHPGSSR